MSLQNARVGQQVVVSFNDAPNCNAVIAEIDMLDMKKMLRSKRGTVSMQVLGQNASGTFSLFTIEHTQIVEYGAMLNLGKSKTEESTEYDDIQFRLYEVLPNAVNGRNEPMNIGGDGKISYHMLVESGDFGWSRKQYQELIDLAVGKTSSKGIKRVR